MAKQALVTGSDGFVGRHLVRALDARGYRVLEVDVVQGNDAIKYFQRGTDRFDLVAHCAYVVGGRATIDGRNTALIENELLDASLFDWALRTRQKAVLYFSSSAAYPVHYQGKTCNKILREDDINVYSPYPGDAHYGAAKLMGERMARVAGENGLRVHVVRPFSGCSHKQSLDYPWPSIARRVTEGDFTVWGDEGQTRDWIDIVDVVEGSLQVFEQDIREPINLCTGIGTEMGQLMKMFSKRWNGYDPDITYLVDKPTGVFTRVGDPAKMFEIYKPQKTLEQMIDETVLSLQN